MTATEAAGAGRVADAVRRAVDDAPPLPAAAVALLRATGLHPRGVAR